MGYELTGTNLAFSYFRNFPGTFLTWVHFDHVLIKRKSIERFPAFGTDNIEFNYHDALLLKDRV